MKKAAIILAIITAGIALLFAQTPDPAPAKVVPAETALTAPAVAPVVAAEPVAVEEPVAAEETAPVAEAAADEEEMVTDEIAMMDEIGEDAAIEEGRISLRLKDAELKDVVRMFSTLSDANIIVPDMGDEEIVKKIDVNLDNVEWQPALEAILDTHNLELYEKIPGTKVYAIRKKEPGAPDPLDVQVFKLSYASVNSVTGIVADLVGSTGSYSVFPERNVVVVQGTAKALLGIDGIMKQIDLPRQQVFIESKFLELSDTAQKDLGINWQVLSGYGVGVRDIGGSYNYNDSKNDQINNSRNAGVNNSSGANRFADIEGRSYENLPEEGGEPVPIDTDGDGFFDYVYNGIDFPARPASLGADSSRIYGITPTTFSEDLSTLVTEAGVSTLDASTVTRALGATLSASDFNLILSALEQQDGIEIVSNPKIIVANEEEALIHLGDMEPNVVIEERAGTSDSPGASTSVKVDGYFEDGVKVVVKPTINTSSNITVRITPEITTFIGRKVINSSTTGLKLIDYPISRTKKINTVFSLESGQTAAIGGLTQVSDTSEESQIPILGSLPLIGRFFSYEHMIRDQNETIIFVTVGLANPSSIDMETGMPQNTRLAQRYQIRERADRRVDLAERNILQTKENMEMKKELKDLREANQKLIDQQKDQKAKEKAKEEARAAKEAAKQAEEEAGAMQVEPDEPVVESVAVLEEEPATVLEEVSPEAVSVDAEIAPEEEIAPVQEPVEEISPVQEIIEDLEGSSGGGVYNVTAPETEKE